MLPTQSPAMKIASAADVAGVEAPKISRSSRSQVVWYISAQAPDANASTGTVGSPIERGVAEGRAEDGRNFSAEDDAN
jgi:hypothetical protein